MSQSKVFNANSNGFYVDNGRSNRINGFNSPANMGNMDFDNVDTIKGGDNGFANYNPKSMGFDFNKVLSSTVDKLVTQGQKAVVKAGTNAINDALGIKPPTLTAEQISQGYVLNSQGQAVQTTNSYVTQSDPNMKYYLMGGAAFLGAILLIAVLKK